MLAAQRTLRTRRREIAQYGRPVLVRHLSSLSRGPDRDSPFRLEERRFGHGHNQQPTSNMIFQCQYTQKMRYQTFSMLQESMSRELVGSPGIVEPSLGSRGTRRRTPDFGFSSPSHVCFSTSPAAKTEDRKEQPEQEPENVVAKPFYTSVKIPTPKEPVSTSQGILANFDPMKFASLVATTTWSALKMIFRVIIKTPGTIFYYLTHGEERAAKIQEIRDAAKKEFDHYWMGTKLLMADVRTARSLVGRTLTGSTLTRRERKQLLRTVSDLFRLVPFSMFLIIPFMEFALPFALRIFPNMLPSTFQDSLKAEENMKRELQSRIAMAQFFQETMAELAKEQKRVAQKRKEKAKPAEGSGGTVTEAESIATKQEESAQSLLNFLERARSGEVLPPDVIIQYAKYFQDDLTLDNMPRMQLVNMCKYMTIPPYGSDSFLRFQLRHKIRMLKEDDQRIIWEGVGSLTKMELREACQERGMRSTGMSKDSYKKALEQWLELSVNRNVPISLLIMSRTFFLQEEMISPGSQTTDDPSVAVQNVSSLADTISGLDKEVLNEVVLEVATSEEKKSDPNVRKIKLEVLTQQNERIKQEQAEREAKKKPSTPETAPAPESQDTPAKDKEQEEAKKKVTVEITVEDHPEKTQPEPAPVVKDKEDEERNLSSEEMDALTELLNPDPVSREKADLEKIKKAMEDGEKVDADGEAALTEAAETTIAKAVKVEEALDNVLQKEEEILSKLSDKIAAEKIEKIEQEAEREAAASTTFSKDGASATDEPPEDKPQESKPTEAEDEGDDDAEADDPVVARLKKQIKAMVDKIDKQLSDVQIKIGDKLHLLDKDMDGVLTIDEVAEVLQQVLRRELTAEEARDLVEDIDENHDGVLTVQELVNWIDTHKLLTYEKEGRDADMDRVLESKPSVETAETGTEKQDEAQPKVPS